MDHKKKDFRLNILIDSDIVKECKDANMKLCLVQSFADPFLNKPNPTIWIAFSDYVEDNTLVWERNNGYQGYAMDQDDGEDSFRFPINFGQTFVIVNIAGHGHGKIKEERNAINDGIMVKNHTMKTFTAGLEQEFIINNSKQPSVPISKQDVRSYLPVVIRPTEKVYVAFAPSKTISGEIVAKSWNSGILVDMRNFHRELVERQIKYTRGADGKSCQWETSPDSKDIWSSIIRENEDLFPYLIPEDERGKQSKRIGSSFKNKGQNSVVTTLNEAVNPQDPS